MYVFNFGPITLLNSELKILAWVLAKRMQLVVSDLVGPEQNYAVKARSIQDNLHLVCGILEGIEDDTEAALTSLDQSKVFDRVDHRFLAAVLQTPWFKLVFRRWISILYYIPSSSTGERKALRYLRDWAVGPAGLAPVSFSLCPCLEPLLRRLRNEKANPALIGVPLPGPFRWIDGLVRILGVWFWPDLQLEQNWSEVQTKVEAKVGTWLQRCLSLKGRAEACAVYVFSLILYRLSVLPLPKGPLEGVLKQSLSKLLWGGRSPMVRRQVCHQRLCNGGLKMPDLESHWFAERLAFLGRSLTRDTVWGQNVKKAFPRLMSNPKAESCRRPRGEAPFFAECRKALCNLPWSSDLSWSRKELVVGTASDLLVERLDWSQNEICSQWNWAPDSDFLAARSERIAPCWLGFQSGLGRHARLHSLWQ